MTVKERRARVFEQMADRSGLILYSGVEAMGPFHANSNFFYLTGLRRENMILVMAKSGEVTSTMLFIEEADPFAVRWTGKRVSVEEAKETSLIDEVYFLNAFQGRMARLLMAAPENMYFDCSRCAAENIQDHNAVKAREFAQKYPHIQVKDLYPLVGALRMQKDETEVAKIKESIHITDLALQNVLTHLKPGMMEYQAQADFEYTVKTLGAEELAFPTIAGSGSNGTMLHYGTNRDECKDGDLLLLDLGARCSGYCADITRTYPVNGKFTERQRQVYEIVLKANRTVAATAKAGMTIAELQELCKQVLAEGCIGLGLIKDASEIGKYYMHGVSHHLGIDCHDATVGAGPMKAGTVISDEPGLYIDEWGIGIRIEDDLLIKEDGCEVLSEEVIRDPDEIEAFMAGNK